MYALSQYADVCWRVSVRRNEKGSGSGNSEEERVLRAVNESHKEGSDQSLCLQDHRKQRSGNDIATDR
jgi:hypothetical protein